VATVMACAGLAAVSGSSIGTAATMAKLSVKEMMRYGYPAALASATVAVAGTLGVIIPPSTFLVIYAILTGESVAQLLAAGVIPGLLSALGYIVYILLIGRRQIVPPEAGLASVLVNAKAEAAASGSLRAPRISADPARPRPQARGAQRPARLPWRGLVRLAVLFLIILGGLYSGLFTTIESAAIAALAALVMVVLEFRRDGASAIWAAIKGALLDTARTSSMVLMILVGSGILSAFLVVARVPEAATEWVTSLDIPPALTMALLLLCLLPLGTALDEISVLIITIPIIYPIAMELGFDGVWLGLMIVKLTAIGMVTPPVGMTCFVVSGATGVKIETVFKGVTPFIIMDLIVSAILFIFPGIVLFLPSLVSTAQ
jgi:C4-dicarboxylate transporter DctM subunit